MVGNGAFAEPPAYVARAIADPARAGDAGADARRHPADLTAFATVKPGDTVVDLGSLAVTTELLLRMATARSLHMKPATAIGIPYRAYEDPQGGTALGAIGREK